MSRPSNLTMLCLFVVGATLTACAQMKHRSLDPEVAARRAARTKPDFSLKIRAKESTIKVGSPVMIQVTVTNLFDEEIALNSFSRPNFDQIILRNADGNQCLPKRGDDPVKDIRVGSDHLFFVQPGAPELRGFVVPEDYDLSKPGKYTLQFQVYDEVIKTYVKSNTITFIVTP